MPQARKPRRKSAAASRSSRAAPLPDRRAMEAFLATRGGRPADPGLREAQDVMYRAWDTAGRQARLALARRALKISPLCADAYVLLAEEGAGSLDEARDLYARGVAAGELALGPRAFEEDVGHFWGLLETRPYMRARCGLAQALWAAGERAGAIAHYRDMLRLNPNDNQGIRYLLATCLLESGDDGALQELLKAYDEDGSPYWTYTKALRAFRASGATKEADALLAEAVASNEHVPTFLSGEKALPRDMPDYITVGGEDEAAEYARACGPTWKATPGALDWLARTVAGLPPPPKRGTGSPH